VKCAATTSQTATVYNTFMGPPASADVAPPPRDALEHTIPLRRVLALPC
jgi:hypothetical protein